VDQETINGLADLIAQKLPIPVWWLIAIQAALTLLAAGVGAFFGEYLRIRGRNLATKADFNSLSAQLQANTETVEKIKSNVAQRDWEKREWVTLRRIKLERLLERMHECEAFLERHRSACIHGNVLNEGYPVGEIETLGTLYFPELENEIYEFAQCFRTRIATGLRLVQELIDARDDAAATQNLLSKYSGKFSGADLPQAIIDLQKASRRLLLEIAELTPKSA